MKRFAILLLALAMLLCSCNKTGNDESKETTPIDGYVHDYDENDRLSLTVQYKDVLNIAMTTTATSCFSKQLLTESLFRQSVINMKITSI